MPLPLPNLGGTPGNEWACPDFPLGGWGLAKEGYQDSATSYPWQVLKVDLAMHQFYDNWKLVAAAAAVVAVVVVVECCHNLMNTTTHVVDTGRKRTLFHCKWVNSISNISRMLH